MQEAWAQSPALLDSLPPAPSKTAWCGPQIKYFITWKTKQRWYLFHGSRDSGGVKVLSGQPAGTRWCDSHWGLPIQGQPINLVSQLDVRENVDHLGDNQRLKFCVCDSLSPPAWLHCSLTCPRCWRWAAGRGPAQACSSCSRAWRWHCPCAEGSTVTDGNSHNPASSPEQESSHVWGILNYQLLFFLVVSTQPSLPRSRYLSWASEQAESGHPQELQAAPEHRWQNIPPWVACDWPS